MWKSSSDRFLDQLLNSKSVLPHRYGFNPLTRIRHKLRVLLCKATREPDECHDADWGIRLASIEQGSYVISSAHFNIAI